MNAKWLCGLILGILGITHLQAAEIKTIKLGFIDPVRGEARYNAEFLRYDRMMPVYRENHIEPALIEEGPFIRGSATEEQIFDLLKPFHVVALFNTYDQSLKLTAELRALAPNVRAGLLRYVREGGGLLVFPQGLRYPNDDDIKYWNLVFEGLGLQILPEGLFDPTRSFQGRDLDATTYWYTQNIKPHPVTEGVLRLVLPLYPAGQWPGVSAIKYSPDWQVIVSGEKEAKSFQCGSDNTINLEKEGACASAPTIVAGRPIGKGRAICFPLANVHAGLNYNVPIWDNTVETRGNKAAELPSFTLKLILNAYRWLAEPALSVAELGANENPPYKEVEYPPTVEWDQASFGVPNKDDIRGIWGAVSSHAGGKGSVADYAQAAKGAGLSFIVFADPLEKLTSETLAKLKADCAEASKGGDFYACPGVEFSDGLDNRWVFWGEKVAFPEKSFIGPGSKKVYEQWDGKKVRHYGQYEMMCQLGASALLDYKKLRSNGAHPENLWWFFDYFPLVFSQNKLVADNYAEFLHGLSDLRWAALSSFTRVENPSEVSTAGATCFTGFHDLDSARKVMNNRCSSQFAARSGGQYVSQGPVILAWEAINPQMESNWKKTRGAQRVRLKFTVASYDGIVDVKVHDGERAIFRRFLGNGEKEMTREFECVHDQQHYLTLEVTDTKGRRAFSWVVLIWCYKQGLFRCGDNLNILGATGLVWHPDRNEMMPPTKPFENGVNYSISGWDTGGYLCPAPRTWLEEIIITAENGDYPQFRKDGIIGKILDVPLSSHNLQIATQKMTKLAEPHETDTRPTPAFCTVPRDLGPINFFERTHTIYAPATRTDWYTSWNYRRPREGIKDYRGGLIWHEGRIKFTKDVTLNGNVPIKLMRLTCPVSLEKGWGDMVIVTNENGKTRVARVADEKKPVRFTGRIRAGGYAAIMPTLVGYEAFLAPAGNEFSYEVELPGRVTVGLGKNNQTIKAGTEFAYQFALGSFADPAVGNDLLEDTAAALNMDAGKEGYSVMMKTGQFTGGPFFCTVKAENNEVAFKIGPRDLIIDLPFRVQGLEDNGCAAVYSSSRRWFRFVPVVDGTAWFQDPISPAVDLWVGNILVCKNKAVKVTVVVDGQKEGKKPFVEFHNPTDEAIKTSVVSPSNTPVFGGLEAEITIPAGNTARFEMDGKKLTAMEPSKFP